MTGATISSQNKGGSRLEVGNVRELIGGEGILVHHLPRRVLGFSGFDRAASSFLGLLMMSNGEGLKFLEFGDVGS